MRLSSGDWKSGVDSIQHLPVILMQRLSMQGQTDWRELEHIGTIHPRLMMMRFATLRTKQGSSSFTRCMEVLTWHYGPGGFPGYSSPLGCIFGYYVDRMIGSVMFLHHPFFVLPAPLPLWCPSVVLAFPTL